MPLENVVVPGWETRLVEILLRCLEQKLIASPEGPQLKVYVREIRGLVERQCIAKALEQTHGNRTQAARRLGISRRALMYKMKAFGLSPNSNLNKPPAPTSPETAP